MATMVQTTGIETKTNSSVTPEAFTAPGNFTAGNDAIFACCYFQSSSNFITGVTIGGTAATLESRQFISGTGSTIEFWRARNIAGGTNAISVASTTSAHYYNFSVEEWNGLANSVVDITANTGTGTSNAPSATYGTLAQADELVYVGWVDNSGVAITTITPPTGYTTSFAQNDGAGSIAGAAAYKVVNSSAGASPAFSLSSSPQWYSALATFKLDVAAAAASASVAHMD